jgi:hypothetical protein
MRVNGKGRRCVLTISSVTLARPHPAIVGKMVPFLHKLDIAVKQVTVVSDLPGLITLHTDAVVISLAQTSTVSVCVEYILREVMRLNPNVILIFSSELPLHKKQKNLQYLLSAYFSAIDIVSVDSSPALFSNTNHRCLYICGADLDNETRRDTLTAILKNW